MKKLLIVTDAWSPQVNGVATLFERLVPLLRERSLAVTVVHPGMFQTIPFFLYPEIPLSLFPHSRMQKIFASEKPDFVHIVTEWTLGFTARAVCLEEGLTFTTSYHTNFPEYVRHYLKRTAGKPFTLSAYQYMRWFHKASAGCIGQ